jgi:hypothetical protein
MLKAIALTTAALILAAAPALAASSYYVVHAPHSKSCSVVEKAPDGKNLLMVGKHHSSMSAATRAMHTSVSCTAKKTGSKY